MRLLRASFTREDYVQAFTVLTVFTGTANCHPRAQKVQEHQSVDATCGMTPL